MKVRNAALRVLCQGAATLILFVTEAQPAHAFVAAVADKPIRNHLSVSIGVTPFYAATGAEKTDQYIGIGAVPSLRYSRTVDNVDGVRGFVSFDWAAFSAAGTPALGDSVEPVEFVSQRVMIAAGAAFRVSREDTSAQANTSAGFNWFSVGLGYGNIRTANGALDQAVAVLLSFYVDAVSWNIGNADDVQALK